MTPDVLELPVNTAVGVVQVIVLFVPALIFGKTVFVVKATVAVAEQPLIGLVTLRV